jgi:hypothetical protein
MLLVPTNLQIAQLSWALLFPGDLMLFAGVNNCRHAWASSCLLLQFLEQLVDRAPRRARARE